jgi:hypothetical protein
MVRDRGAHAARVILRSERRMYVARALSSRIARG